MVVADRTADCVSVHYCAVLLCTRDHTKTAGDGSGSDSYSVIGESYMCAGVYQAIDVCADFYGVGEAVSGDVLFDVVGYKTSLDILLSADFYPSKCTDCTHKFLPIYEFVLLVE